MNTDRALRADEADEYARWFRCLADGTRLRVLHAVAAADQSMTIGDIVAAVGRSQSTVSKHVQILADQEFVFLEPDGVRTRVRVNDACMTALPDAAAVIMASTIMTSTGRPERR